jgi:hypothetical protein
LADYAFGSIRPTAFPLTSSARPCQARLLLGDTCAFQALADQVID